MLDVGCVMSVTSLPMPGLTMRTPSPRPRASPVCRCCRGRARRAPDDGPCEYWRTAGAHQRQRGSRHRRQRHGELGSSRHGTGRGRVPRAGLRHVDRLRRCRHRLFDLLQTRSSQDSLVVAHTRSSSLQPMPAGCRPARSTRAITLPASLPTVPLDVRADGRDKALHVAWLPPANEGAPQWLCHHDRRSRWNAGGDGDGVRCLHASA